MPTNSIRSFTRMAGPNCSLYLARRGLLVSGGRISTFHSGWSPRSRFTISPTRPSWYPSTDETNVTVTIASGPRTGGTHIKFVRRRPQEKDHGRGLLCRRRAVFRGFRGG